MKILAMVLIGGAALAIAFSGYAAWRVSSEGYSPLILLTMMKAVVTGRAQHFDGNTYVILADHFPKSLEKHHGLKYVEQLGSIAIFEKNGKPVHIGMRGMNLFWKLTDDSGALRNR